MKQVKNKFLKYIKFDTQSNPESNTIPSTVKQFELAKVLQTELEQLELKNIKLKSFCFLVQIKLSLKFLKNQMNQVLNGKKQFYLKQ